MAGLKGRSGRPPGRLKKSLEDHYDAASIKTIRAAAILMDDESVPLLDRVRVCLPLALKRVPDRHEIVAMTMNVSNETATGLLEMARENLKLRQSLLFDLKSKRTSDNIESRDTVVVTDYNETT